MTDDQIAEWWKAIPKKKQGDILNQMLLRPGDDVEDLDEFFDTVENLWSRWDMGLPIKPTYLRMVRGWLRDQKVEA